MLAASRAGCADVGPVVLEPLLHGDAGLAEGPWRGLTPDCAENWAELIGGSETYRRYAVIKLDVEAALRAGKDPVEAFARSFMRITLKEQERRQNAQGKRSIRVYSMDLFRRPWL